MADSEVVPTAESEVRMSLNDLDSWGFSVLRFQMLEVARFRIVIHDGYVVRSPDVRNERIDAFHGFFVAVPIENDDVEHDFRCLRGFLEVREVFLERGYPMWQRVRRIGQKAHFRPPRFGWVFARGNGGERSAYFGNPEYLFREIVP